MSLEQCPQCGQGPIATSIEEDVLHMRVPPFTNDSIIKVPVMVPIRTCQACDYRYTDHESEKIRDDRANEYLYSVGHGRPKEWSPKWGNQGPRQTG